MKTVNVMISPDMHTLYREKLRKRLLYMHGHSPCLGNATLPLPTTSLHKSDLPLSVACHTHGPASLSGLPHSWACLSLSGLPHSWAFQYWSEVWVYVPVRLYYSLASHILEILNINTDKLVCGCKYIHVPYTNLALIQTQLKFDRITLTKCVTVLPTLRFSPSNRHW